MKCPTCEHIIEISGYSDEKKIVSCEQCGLKGYYKFPADKEEQKTKPIPYDDISVIELIRYFVARQKENCLILFQ